MTKIAGMMDESKRLELQKIKEMEDGISSMCKCFDELVLKPATEILLTKYCQINEGALTLDFHKAYGESQAAIAEASLALRRLSSVSATISRAAVTIEES